MKLPPAGMPVVVQDYIPLPARSPEDLDGSPLECEIVEAFISRKMMEHLEQYGPRRKFYDIRSITDALETPAVIFEGLQRHPFEQAYCYSCVPARRWLNEEDTGPPPPWQVFLVYVVRMDGKLVVLDWNWRPADRSKPYYPKNWEQDYARRLWPQTD
jgi:hypothetical protein